MKILVIGKPKSGTSMLAGRIKTGMDAYLGLDSQLLFEPKENDWLNKVQDNNITKILYTSSPKNISNIEEAKKIGVHFDKKIIICRDPRDILISGTLYRWFYGHKPKEEYFKQAFDLVCQKEKNPSSVNLYEISTISIRQGRHKLLNKYKESLKNEYNIFVEDTLKLHKEDWYVVKYEDVITNQINSLNQYIGFEIPQEINSTKRVFRITARSKKYGNWRNWFTEDDITFFKPVFNNTLNQLGYDINDWELNSPQQISSETASEYMKSIFDRKILKDN